MQSTLRKVIISIFFTACGATNAQSPSIGQKRPTVQRATDVLEMTSTEVSVGAPASFRRKSVAAVDNLVKDGLLVRIFSLLPRKDKPEPEPGMQVDDCDVYLATVHRLIKGDSGTLKLETVSTLDKSWLQLSNSAETIEPGVYFIVFEIPGASPMNTEYFRLHRDHAKEYFDTGFKLTILANDPKILPAELKARWSKHKQNIGTLRQQLDTLKSTLPCYTFEARRLQALSEQDEPAGDLAACTLPDEVNALPNQNS